MRLRPGITRAIGIASRGNRIDNYLTGYITSIDAAGVITVQVDGYGIITPPNVSGQEMTTGDEVAIRVYDGDINKAEITGKSSRMRSSANPLTVWR
jgi:hypothetical protein